MNKTSKPSSDDTAFIDLTAAPAVVALPSQTESAINDLRIEIGQLERTIDELMATLAPVCIESVNELAELKPETGKQVPLAAIIIIEAYRIKHLNRRFEQLKRNIQL